jgi:hypothetical protein
MHIVALCEVEVRDLRKGVIISYVSGCTHYAIQ